MKKIILTTIIIALCTTMAFSQSETEALKQQSFRRHHIGSSLLVLANFLPEPADYYQLSYGYHITQKDVFKVEAITWKYSEPLGTYGNSEENYPGKIKAYGIGFGYQRFHWKNLFTTIVATPFLQQFYDTDNNKTQKGFQLYIQFIVGYRLELFNKRFFIEPAYALKYWPINTNFPESFLEIEQRKPKYKIEININLGFRL